MARKDPGISQQTEDAIVNLLMTRLVEKGEYRTVMNCATEEDRALIEESLERHAERMREKGEAGW